MNILIDIIAGARPNFVKVAAILRAIDVQKDTAVRLVPRLVHTGQHYDASMSGSFFEQLGIRSPDINLEAGSGSHAEQTAKIMIGYEKLLMEEPSEMCVVVGDVTSTMACAITAKKLNIRVAHVEGGIRSGDISMPEEVNRRVTDSISDYFFTTSETANAHLHLEGVSDDRIYFVGNTMIDTLSANMEHLRKPKFFDAFGLKENGYVVTTMHRPSNVDRRSNFVKMIEAVTTGVQGMPVVFPIHPRAARMLSEISNLPKNLMLVDPQPYLEFNWLVKNARAVITDSGGVTEETTFMGVPCLTLRDNTERPETVTIGTNVLVGTRPEALAPFLQQLHEGDWKKGSIPELWDGRTGPRIVSALQVLLAG